MGFLVKFIQRVIGPLLFFAFMRSIFKDIFRTHTYRRTYWNGNYGNNGAGGKRTYGNYGNYGNSGNYGGYGGYGSYGGYGNYGGYGSSGGSSYTNTNSSSSSSNSNAYQSPYEVFGLPRNATNEQVRAKYRELISKYHPDKFASLDDPQFTQLAAEKFQKIQSAYDQLKRERGM